MIVVAGTIRVPPEKMAALRPHAEAAIAATRREPGCLVYSFAEDLVEPGLLRVYEEWRGGAELEAHGRAPHMSAWRAALVEAGVLARDLKRREAGDGVPL